MEREDAEKAHVENTASLRSELEQAKKEALATQAAELEEVIAALRREQDSIKQQARNREEAAAGEHGRLEKFLRDNHAAAVLQVRV